MAEGEGFEFRPPKAFICNANPLILSTGSQISQLYWIFLYRVLSHFRLPTA